LLGRQKAPDMVISRAMNGYTMRKWWYSLVDSSQIWRWRWT
jgi:hypothetical protein